MKVSILDFPCTENADIFQKLHIFVLSLLVLLVLGIIAGSFIAFQIFIRWKRKLISLKATLIKQKEATQQAERKSLRKSLAFAATSHDIRACLAGITGLIELSLRDVHPESEITKNLVQMNACAFKLLGILNSVLDISKVEEGKMEIAEVEFDLSQVLEESTDIFHVVALKKGIEVIWDPCDFSILKLTTVKGDCRRLKQVLDNLLSNAVKFTSEGHVVLRARVRQPCMEELKLSLESGCHSSGLFAALSVCFCKSKEALGSSDHISLMQHDANLIECIFEVDDTGIGIPREKRASVFENFVQIKESTDEGREGTGLGLGIVQSYVRLMGGEISIKDKEPGEKGTCFTFNIFLKSGETSDSVPAERNMSTESIIRAHAFGRSFTCDSTHAIVLAANTKSREIMHTWLENLDVKVWMVLHDELIPDTHESIVELNNFRGPAKQGMLTFQCGSEDGNQNGHTLPVTMKNSRGSAISILFIIDISCVNISKICRVLKRCIENIHNIEYKFIWLSSPDTSSTDLKIVKDGPCDLILQKPCHGSRLYDMLKLLQSNGRTVSGSAELKMDSVQIAMPSDDKPMNGINVLLVEDCNILQRLGAATLARLGATFEIAQDGSIALDLVKEALRERYRPRHERIDAEGSWKQFPYDVILMDCEMPEMDGYEATRRIRLEEKNYGLHVPIIALTAHTTAEEEKKSMLSGMDFHLTKPLQMQTAKLVDIINVICPR